MRRYGNYLLTLLLCPGLGYFKKMKKGVILLHGIARTWRCMRRLDAYLQACGFATLNIDYPSTRMALSEIAAHIHPAIQKFEAGLETQEKDHLHFIGYSMGGLVIRAYLNQYRPRQMGRVVMLGTPNGGSEVADVLQNLFLYRRLFGPGGQQLVTDQRSFRHLFGQVDYALGIIAGRTRFSPLVDFIMKAPHDGKVTVASTQITGMTDHIVIPSTHFLLPANKTAWQQTAHFLEHGSFMRSFL